MKILYRGMRPEDRIYRGQCYNCGTEVEFQRKEAQYTNLS